MKNKKALLIFIIVLVVVISIALFWYFKIYKKSSDSKTIKPLETIEEFNYELEARDTELYKREYYVLKDLLSKSEIDYTEYAKQVAKLYIIDLYTINNKENLYDVGSLEFVYPSIRDNFELKVKDTIYKYVENDSENRNQVLPEVSNVQIGEVKEDSIVFQEKTFSSYDIQISWDYVEDLGYDKNTELILVRDDKNVYVLEQK